jgi:hypothetical protein
LNFYAQILSHDTFASFVCGLFFSVFGVCSMHVFLKEYLGAFSHLFWRFELTITVGCLCAQMLVFIEVSCSWSILMFFPRYQQVPFVVLLNLCFSTLIIIAFVHFLLVQPFESASFNFFEHLQQLIFLNYCFLRSSRELSSPWFKTFVAPWLVILLMFLLFHSCCSLIVDLPNVFVVPLLILFS